MHYNVFNTVTTNNNDNNKSFCHITLSFHPSIHTHGKSTALLQIQLPTLILLQHTVTHKYKHTLPGCVSHTHWTSAVCLILSVWVPSASFCSLLHSAVLSFSTAALTLSHYYPIHPLSPIPLPHISLSLPTACNLRLLFSHLFTFLYHFLFLQYNFSILFVTCPFSSSTSSVALIIFLSPLRHCHTFPPATHAAALLCPLSSTISQLLEDVGYRKQ